MRNTQQQQFKNDSTNLLYQNLQNCNCCPYGYHIDLDFVRYCESLVGGKPSDGQLLRRDKRRSRKSLEVMLGLDTLCLWEPTDKVQPVKEVQVEVEPDSPRVVDKIQNYSSSCYDSLLTTQTTTIPTTATPSLGEIIRTNLSSPETSAFLHDALDDVVNDFERTLERTKKKNRINIPWDQYIDVFDSCVSANKSHHSSSKDVVLLSPPQQLVQQQQQQEKEDVESVGSNGSELDTQTLQNIREQMAKSLSRMKELEEQVKNIPVLQKQLSSLKEQKRQLELRLKKEESETKSPVNHVSNTITDHTITKTTITTTSTKKPITLSFTPQKVSPVALESLGSHIRSNSQSEITRKTVKRDVGIMCTQHTKDIGTLAISCPMVRSIGTNPMNTASINDHLYTNREVEELIKASLREYEDRRRAIRKQNAVSVGTQMAPKPQPLVKDIFVQTVTIKEKTVQKMSQGVMAIPIKKDVFLTVRPETRTIGCSDHKITVPPCDTCSTSKRTVGCGPDSEENKNYLSLKQMDMPPRSLSFSLGEYEKLHIKRKTVGTQYHRSVQNIGIQNTPTMNTVAIQNSVICLSKSCQHTSEGASKHTDTEDLLRRAHKHTNTDEYESVNSTKPITTDSHSNTDIIRTREHGTNPSHAIQLIHASSNTEKILKKDVGCGDIMKPHITITCADNYCDSCKDAIKHLAKEFGLKIPTIPVAPTSSPITSSPVLGNGTKIPRPTTLTSPRTTRKLFTRQNTYTIPSSPPSPSPLAEKKNIGATEIKRLSASLDSVSTSSSSASSSSPVATQAAKGVSGTVSLSTIKPEKFSVPVLSQSYEEVTPSTSGKAEEEEKGGRLLTTEVKSSLLSLQGTKTERTRSISGDDVRKATTETNEVEASSQSRKTGTTSHHSQNMLLNKLATSTSEPRTKTTPSKEMKAAMKVINDSLQKSTSKTNNLKNANAIVQNEWFKISSTDQANPMDVEDYLDCFEEYSNSLLKHIVNMIDSNGNTAMHYALSHGNFDVVSILLDSKVCNVNQTNNAGYTCVMLVSLAKLKNSAHRTVVQRLFQMADVNIRAKKHCQTALMLAVSHGNLDMVEMLLKAGADINIQDEDGSTALMCAAEHGRIDIVKHLLSQQDCDSLIQDVDGSTAFKIAWQAGNRDIGLLLYVHEQMLRSKMPNVKPEQRSPATPRHQKAYQMHQQQQLQQQQQQQQQQLSQHKQK